LLVIAPGIPVCSITTRYNLFVGGVCGRRWSYFWGVFAPWIAGFAFCQVHQLFYVALALVQDQIDLAVLMHLLMAVRVNCLPIY
jgi:hypothetical protein